MVTKKDSFAPLSLTAADNPGQDPNRPFAERQVIDGVLISGGWVDPPVEGFGFSRTGFVLRTDYRVNPGRAVTVEFQTPAGLVLRRVETRVVCLQELEAGGCLLGCAFPEPMSANDPAPFP
jgi:hypothetical protein